VNTRATKDDWEEINFEFNSSILTDGFPTLLWLADFLHTNPGYRLTSARLDARCRASGASSQEYR